MRDVTMEALRDQFDMEGKWVNGPRDGKPGGRFMATEKEARDFQENAPHLARRVSAPHVPPADQANAMADPAAAWEATGIAMSPQEYLEKFKGLGDHADVARAALRATATPAPEPASTASEPVKPARAAKAKVE